MKKIYVLSVMCSFLPALMFAGGYQVKLQGNKQTGMGLVGTPNAFGASTIFYNPGALSFTDSKLDFEAGLSLLFANAAFQGSSSNYNAETNNGLSTPFYLYGAGKINDNLSVGLGVYTPFGSSVKWEDDWAGKLLIQRISLSAIFIQPTLSYKINDIIGVGAGFIYAIGSVNLKRSLNYSNDPTVELDGSATNIGFNLGVYINPTDRLHIGIDYRSRIDMKVTNGDATFETPASLQSSIPPSNTFDATLPLPANLDFGISYDISDQWLVAFELDYVFWSVYKELEFKFKNDEAGLLSSVNPRKYSDSFIPRLGFQYSANDHLHFRFGGYYDPTPTNEEYFTPETISLNTLAFTLGLSYEPVEDLSIDISYLQLHGLKDERTYKPDEFSGYYQTFTMIPGLGVSYKF